MRVRLALRARPFRRPARRGAPGGLRWALLALALLAAAGPGCGGGDIAAHLDKGEAHFADGRFEEAQLEGLYVLLREPEHPAALKLVATSLLALDRDGEAESYFRTLTAAAPAEAGPVAALYHQRARTDFATNQKSRAARRWAVALSFAPRLELGPYAYYMADLAYADRDWTQAAALYSQALAAAPDSSAAVDAIYPYTVSLHKLGRDPEALGLLEPWLGQQPRHRQRHEAIWLYQELLIGEARAANSRMDYERALSYLRKVLQFKENPPLTAEALLELGAAYESLRNYEQAVRCYRRVIDESNTQTGRIYDSAIERLATLEKARLR